MTVTPLCPINDLPDNATLALCVAGQPILLVNDGGTIHAIANECNHAFMPLEGGRVRNGWIACPAHGARFDLASGEALGPPAREAIATFPAWVEDGMIYAEL